MSDLGLYALRLALLAALTGVAVGVAGGRSGRRDLEQIARRAVWLTFAFTAFAIGALAFCLATFDFQLQYVSEHVARGMTLPYRLAAVWGGQGGSLLLWDLATGKSKPLLTDTKGRVRTTTLGPGKDGRLSRPPLANPHRQIHTITERSTDETT